MEALYNLVRQTISAYVVPYSTVLKTGWVGLAVAVFGILTSGRLIARYGRHHTASPIIPSVNGKLGWMFMEAMSPITVLLFFNTYKNPGPSLSKGQVLLGLWLLHYLNRSVVSVILSPGMKSSRLDTVLMGFFFNFVNAGWIGYDLARLNTDDFNFTNGTIFGLTMFAAGMAINISSDYYLQSIRRRKGKSEEYVLPDWGLYNYIVSPNYAGEIVEWIGYALMMGRESGWSFALWTFCNLAPRAKSNLAWYKEKFEGKIGNRKSLIPGVM